MDEKQPVPGSSIAGIYREADDAPASPSVSDLLAPPPAPPSAAILPPPPPPKPTYSPDETPLQTEGIRTFKSDLAHSIQDKNTSVVQIALAESRKRDKALHEMQSESIKSGKNVALLIASVILILGGLGTAGYFLWPKKAAQIAVPTDNRPIIVTDSQEELDVSSLNRGDLTEKLGSQVAANSANLGTVSRIVPFDASTGTKTALSGQVFMSRISANIPEQLLRSIQPDFYFGVHVFTKNEPYLILKTDSYQAAFAGMLAWEKDMPYDLADIFLNKTDRDSTLSGIIAFKDTVVANKDVRELDDSVSHAPSLIYSFVDKNTLVIATNEQTLSEISDRLQKAALIK